MIITIVRFPGTSVASAQEALDAVSESAPSYLDVPGLLWKSYVRAEDSSVGGIYWWVDRASAEAKFNPGWLAGVTAKYGAEPEVEYLESTLVVDVVNGAIRTQPPTLHAT